jgi:transcription elongation factor GreA
VVGIGDTVIIRENGFPEEKYYVVGSKEADPSNGLISHLSPIGKAIMGRKVGDNVDVQVPDGLITFTIIKIE